MSDQGFIIMYRFRFLFGGLLIVAAVLLLSLVLSLINTSQVQAESGTPSYAGNSSYDGANVVTDAFDAALNGTSQITASVVSAGQNVSSGMKQASASTVNGGKYLAGGVYNTAGSALHGVSTAVLFTARLPVYAWHGVSNVTHLSSFINPASSDKTEPPRIDPAIAAEIANSRSLIKSMPVSAAFNTKPQWPIHGGITEEFGVPHWPWQPVHTGIDISDGAVQGITPVHPFKPGRVIVVIHSSEGFGNHVIIDHGNGMTSLYGHMYSTAVQVGQEVNQSTVLGTEGTTGLSTGVHVHFEIDINGAPANPHLYVNGQP
jgi:murein DD-endopeptidase MepM/ murein hydrolase activator NlpD